MTKQLAYIVLIGILLLLFGCKGKEEKGAIVAQVNDEVLTLNDFKAYFSQSEWQALTPEDKSKYIQQWINITLLAQEADRLKLDKDKQIQQQIKSAEKKIKGNAVIAGRLASMKISEEDLFNYYRIHQGEFQKPLMEYKVQRIFIKNQLFADKVKNDIAAGLSFENAARAFSEESLGANGGFMGFVTSADADSSFWLAIKDLQKLEMTILAKDNGYYILRYIDTRPGSGEASFETMKDEIRRRIQQERQQQVIEELIKELKQKADIYIL